MSKLINPDKIKTEIIMGGRITKTTIEVGAYEIAFTGTV